MWTTINMLHTQRIQRAGCSVVGRKAIAGDIRWWVAQFGLKLPLLVTFVSTNSAVLTVGLGSVRMGEKSKVKSAQWPVEALLVVEPVSSG